MNISEFLIAIFARDSLMGVTEIEMAAVWNEIRKEATCPMCFDLYVEPKILPCLHTICKKCLISERGMANTGIGLATGERQERRCCLCPEKFTLTSVETFPTNTASLHLVESFTKYDQFSKRAPPLCQSCGCESQAGLAVASCLHCNIFLCAKCVIVHKKLPLTSIHKVVCLDDVKSGKIDLNSVLNCKQDVCSVHDKPLELFCEKEKCFLCLGCAIVQHRDHPYNFISQIVEEQREEMCCKVPDVLKRVSQLEQAITEIEKQQFLIQKRKEENVIKIEKTFEVVLATVVQRKEKMLDYVNKVVQRKLQSLNKQLNEIEILLYQMEQYVDFSKETMMSENSYTVMCMKNPIIDRGRSLVKQFSETKLVPSELLVRNMEFLTLDNVLMMIKQLGVVPQSKSCSVKMDKTVDADFCQFTLTVKNEAGDPILGCATSINAVFSTSKGGPTTPLQVYDAGNGEYMFFKSCRACCKECNKPMQRIVNVSHSRCYCFQCNRHCTIVWNQWVSVLVNGKHVPGSPFK